MRAVPGTQRATCEDTWRTPCLKLPSSFLLRRKSSQEKLTKAKSQMLWLKECYCSQMGTAQGEHKSKIRLKDLWHQQESGGQKWNQE